MDSRYFLAKCPTRGCEKIGFTHYSKELGWVCHHLDKDGKIKATCHTWLNRQEPQEIELDQRNLEWISRFVKKEADWSKPFIEAEQRIIDAENWNHDMMETVRVEKEKEW